MVGVQSAANPSSALSAHRERNQEENYTCDKDADKTTRKRTDKEKGKD